MEIVDSILAVFSVWGQMLPMPLEDKHAWARRLRGINYGQFERGVKHLSRRGLITISKIENQKFITLTKAGQLELLLKKAKIKHKQKWDGKWRLVMFDIPEGAKDKRQVFRRLLKSNGFYKLQASVYINPYPLNNSAIDYLKEVKLIDYIRILRVDKMDQDLVLKKHFNLSK